MVKLSPVRTDDGSLTFHNDEFGECYHSTSGALEEALEKHVLPSKVIERSGEVVVGDVCFGLGYNSIVAMKQFFEKNPDSFMQIFAFENDIHILEKIKDLDLPDEYKPYQEKIVSLLNTVQEQTNDYTLYVHTDDQVSISLYLGDVRHTLLMIADDVFDVVFFDPFSPKKHPVLWEMQFFEEVYRSMNFNSVLTTYSCARKVREAMNAVGFIVSDGPSIGRKSPSTIAVKK